MWPRSSTKSWPLGLSCIARSSAASSAAGPSVAQRGAEIDHVLLAEAHVELAGRGEPDAVAALAEIVAHRRDEAEKAVGFLDEIVAGRAAGAVVGRRRA